MLKNCRLVQGTNFKMCSLQKQTNKQTKEKRYTQFSSCLVIFIFSLNSVNRCEYDLKHNENKRAMLCYFLNSLKVSLHQFNAKNDGLVLLLKIILRRCRLLLRMARME